ncbi:hypothetical protein F5X97DRAFT_140211 [Nemania serpens]|nr:hypothetical protein F5X97DRAFT_140211 [Nemania serpens]
MNRSFPYSGNVIAVTFTRLIMHIEKAFRFYTWPVILGVVPPFPLSPWSFNQGVTSLVSQIVLLLRPGKLRLRNESPFLLLIRLWYEVASSVVICCFFGGGLSLGERGRRGGGRVHFLQWTDHQLSFRARQRIWGTLALLAAFLCWVPNHESKCPEMCGISNNGYQYRANKHQ